VAFGNYEISTHQNGTPFERAGQIKATQRKAHVRRAENDTDREPGPAALTDP